MTAPVVLLRPREACARLSISDDTLRLLCADGLIEVRWLRVPGSKQSNRRIVEASLNAYAESLPLDPPAAS